MDMDIKKILELLPHRYPFLLIDRVTDYKTGEYLTDRMTKNNMINKKGEITIILIALSKSPSASWSAFLQSIIPAPVMSRSFFTSAADILLLIIF